MISVMRTIVDIPDEIIESLDLVRAERGCLRAAVIREALEDYTKANAVEEMQAAFGVWAKRKKDGLDYQKELRDEWGEE